MKKKVFIFILSIIYNVSDGYNFDNHETTVSVEEETEYAHSIPCKRFCEYVSSVNKTPETPVNSKMIEVMMNTPQLHLHRDEPNIFAVLRDTYELPKGFKGPLTEYDFIVVGAGSAGSVLASRLSEGRKASVLVLEAGQGESLLTDIPILAPALQLSEYTWPYLMEHQPGVCMGMEEERCFWPRGKAVGGTSVINNMIYSRGIPADWDRIAADGNYGWSYNDVLPYYIKSERANLKDLQDSPYHGRSGELTVEDVPFRSKLSKALLDAAKIFGHRKVDYNSPDYFGFSNIQATLSRGHRASSAKAFLHNNKKRKNLHILPGSRVTKVLIDPTTKTAFGVEFHKNGQVYQLRAKKEVILSAGPIESPHILMLSGIGPKQHLESFGIPVIQDLKVGESLYDHISFPGLVFTLNSSSLTLREENIANINNFIQFNQYGDGPFSSLAGVETLGYIKTNISKESDNNPDIEILSSCASLASDKGNVIAKGIHLEKSFYKKIYQSIENVESFTILLMLLHPKSKGYLQLRSANPFDSPKLYGNYLTHPDDVATMIEGIRYTIKLIDTPPFRKYGAKLHKKQFPTCKHFAFDSDSYWECAIRSMTATLHHQIATCKMGPYWDPNAVVDPELRVYGLKGLRVIDSSILPRTTVAHTNAPAIMIGERGADIIKRTWKFT